MKRLCYTVMAALFFIASAAVNADAQAEVGIQVSNEGAAFYLAVGDYFKVPEKDVMVVREKGIPDEELPVVYFISARANVTPEVIIDLRLKKYDWMKIAKQYKIGPDVFYFHTSNIVIGSPYGRIFRKYKKPKVQWKTIVLKDPDVINLVNLRFISEHYSYSPEEVMRIRAQGKPFIVVHADVSKSAKAKKELMAGGKGKEKSKGKGPKK